MKTFMASLLILFVALVPSASADVITMENVTTSAASAVGGPAIVHFTVPLPEVPAKAILGYAELQFEASLDPNLEIELWEDTGTQMKPWNVEDSGNIVQTKWVMDKAGGPLVRFDITKLAQDWVSQTKNNNGVLIRLRPDQDAKDMTMAQEPKIKVIYHIVSVDQ